MKGIMQSKTATTATTILTFGLVHAPHGLEATDGGAIRRDRGVADAQRRNRPPKYLETAVHFRVVPVPFQLNLTTDKRCAFCFSFFVFCFAFVA